MNDKTLRKSIIEELDWEPSIDSADVGVTVENGIATLAGHVPTYSQKLTAGDVTKRVRGVKALVQKLEVRPAFAAKDKDEEIARRALNILQWNVLVPDAVKVQVSNGFVTLTGEVEWQYQRRAAEQAMREIAGVTGVLNSIILKARVQPADVKRSIVSALHRNADIEARGIEVDVTDGMVTLKGKVRARYERDLAETAAWAAPGVQAVDDQVTIAF